MVDFNEWSQDPFALFAAFLTLVITVTFISGIIFLFNDKKIKKIVGGLLEVGMHYQCSGVDYDAGSGEDPAPDLRGSIGYILRVRIRTMQRGW